MVRNRGRDMEVEVWNPSYGGVECEDAEVEMKW